MRVYIKKIDEVGVLEFVEIPIEKLNKALRKIPLENIYIILDDMDVSSQDMSTILGDI